MNLSWGLLAGMGLALGLILALSLYSGRQVHSAADFARGGKSGAAVVAGAIMGTLVGGSSTVGTAQLAYSCGLSAWWFTLGAGLGCLLLALVYVRPLRARAQATLVAVVGAEYGRLADLLASLLSCLGMFINIISQLIAAVAVIAIVLPQLGLWPALLLAAGLMVCYVVFGGVLSAGMVGVLKLILLYIAVLAGAGLALSLSGGLAALNSQLDAASSWNLFYRGLARDGGAGLSLILGVITTQSYAQAVLAARNDRAARRGALISAAMIPPIGLGGVLIGLYMRVNFPGLEAKLAFPQFVLTYMPDWLAGLVLATLLIAVVGTGSGLALGVSSIFSRDLLPLLPFNWARRAQNEQKLALRCSRGCIILVLLLACCLSTGQLGDVILNFAFMSMGLRGAVVFVPLCCALWLPRRVSPACICLAIVLGPLTVLVGGLWPACPLEPLFLGVGVAALCALLGLLIGAKQHIKLN